MKKALLLTPLILLLCGCPNIQTSQGKLVSEKTRNAISNVDYIGTVGSQGLTSVPYTIEAINALSDITLTAKFADKDHSTIEIDSKSIARIPAGSGQTVTFSFSLSNALKIKYYQIIVNATATYYDSIF